MGITEDGLMLTLGVDLASAPENTAVCWIAWEDGTATISQVEVSADDAQLVQCLKEGDKVGIDIPFGWPEDFIRAVTSYHEGAMWPSAERAVLRYRATDRFVHKCTGRHPLSVAADRIGIPAMRAAWLFTAFTGSTGQRVCRDGSGRFVEVYPAAALRVWGFDRLQYKGKENGEARKRVLTEIQRRMQGCLQVNHGVSSVCGEVDHALDALIAALIARAAAQGECEPIPSEYVESAKREGWIAVPKQGSLERLVS